MKKNRTLYSYLLYALYFLYFIPYVIAEVTEAFQTLIVLIQSLGCLLCVVLFFARGRKNSMALLLLVSMTVLSGIVTVLSGFSIQNLVRWFAIYKDIFSLAVLTEILYQENPDRYRKITENVLSVGLLLNVASVVFFPNGLVQIANESGVKHPNFFYDYDNHFLTRYILTFALIYLNDQSRKIKRTLPAMLLGLLSVVLTGSVMSALAMGAMILVYLLMKRIPVKLLNIRNIWILYLVAVSAVIVISLSERFAFLADFIGKSQSLSVRTSMWETSIPMICKNWIFGTGVLDTVAMRSHFDYATLHNALLNTLLWGGFVGFVVYTLFIWTVSHQAIRNAGENEAKYFAVLFGGIMILCLMDCIELTPHIYAFFILAANYKAKESPASQA